MIKREGLEDISYEELIARKNKRIKEFYEQDAKLVSLFLNFSKKRCNGIGSSSAKTSILSISTTRSGPN